MTAFGCAAARLVGYEVQRTRHRLLDLFMRDPENKFGKGRTTHEDAGMDWELEVLPIKAGRRKSLGF